MAKKWCPQCDQKQKMTKLDSNTYRCKECGSIRVICSSSEDDSFPVSKLALGGVALYLIGKKIYDSMI